MKSFLFRSTILWTALVLLTSFAAPRDADAAEKINASYGAISGSMAPIWVAKEARLSSLQTGRVQAVIISGIQRRTAARLGFRQVIDLAKLPIEVSGSSIQARRSYLTQNPEITLKFLKAWIEGGFLFKAKSEFS